MSTATPQRNTLYGRENPAETYYCDVSRRVWCVQSPDLAAPGGRPVRADLPNDVEAIPWRQVDGDLQIACAELDGTED